MRQDNRKKLQFLNLNRASRQFAALMLFPIILLTSVGGWVIYYETKQNYLIQQSYVASSILSHYYKKLEQHLGDSSAELVFLQEVLAEEEIDSVAFIRKDSKMTYLGEYPELKPFDGFLNKNTPAGKLVSLGYRDDKNFYAIRLAENDHYQWFVVALNNTVLQIAQYRIVLILAMTIFLIVLFLIGALYFFSRHWLAPMYKMRIQLQRLTAEKLLDYKSIHSTDELNLLQHDLSALLARLSQDFNELKRYVQETEDDTRAMLDRVEIQSANFQNELQTARSINQSKSIFLANISHELRTPLNSIEGFIQLLLRQKNISQEQRLYLETIKKSSAHLLAVINDVLDYSKIEAGKLQLESVPFHLEKAMFDVIDMLSPLASQKDIHLIFYFPSDVPEQVIGDELRFKQILTNLVSNAIKFTPDGEIIVRVHIASKQDNQYLLHFSVQDSGIGIMGAEKTKLFESFTQADASVTRQYGGTGLGLAISKQLVQLMHGKIGFKDNPAQVPTEKGTTFWFTAVFQGLDNVQVKQELYPHLKIISHLQHPATASALRYYLESLQVQHREAVSVFDLFDQLNTIQLNEQDWLIVDDAVDLEASLKQIRQRYQGNLAIYGYPMSLNLALLQKYQAYPLYQPVNRQALLQLLDRQSEQNLQKTANIDGQHLQILAVDDHIPNLMVLEALLQEFNIRLEKANSGYEALNIIQQRIEQRQALFDLIFMDIQMPMMSGIDTTRAIRSLESTLNEPVRMPIIALSAHIFEDDKQKILESGMDGDISKPIRIEQLMYILQKWTKLDENTPMLTAPMREDEYQGKCLDWQMCLELAAQKQDLALELLKMLIQSFDTDCNEIQDLIELEDFPQLEYVLHRIYGATRYVGVPKLQQLSGEFEQFVSQLRKNKQVADEQFIQQVHHYFVELQQCMQQVKEIAETEILPKE